MKVIKRCGSFHSSSYILIQDNVHEMLMHEQFNASAGWQCVGYASFPADQRQSTPEGLPLEEVLGAPATVSERRSIRLQVLQGADACHLVLRCTLGVPYRANDSFLPLNPVIFFSEFVV